MNHRQIPNPCSHILPRAIIGGAGKRLPAAASIPPEGMGAILLYIQDAVRLWADNDAIQQDLGLAWIGASSGIRTGADGSGLNPNSLILKNAIIGGMGMQLPPWESSPPQGMWMVLLYLPMGYVIGNTMNAIQNDLGMPWHCEDGEPAWLDDELDTLTLADA